MKKIPSKTPQRRCLVTTLLPVMITCATASSSVAATIPWNGGGGDGNYATAANWIGGIAPANNDYQDTAAFDAGPRIVTLPASRKVSGLSFLTAGWTISGGSFADLRTITSSGDGTNTVGVPVNAKASATWTLGAGNTLHFSSTFYQRSNNLTLVGGGAITFANSLSGYSGTVGSWGTHISDGTVRISQANPYSTTSAGAFFSSGPTAVLQLQTTVAAAQALVGSRIVDELGAGLVITDLGGGFVSISPPTGPVAVHGRLQTSGNRILDKNGKAISLAGNSLFWSIPAWGASKYWNADVVSFLKNDWKATVIRAAMGVEDGGGYVTDPIANKNLVKAVVDAAIANNVYVIIDWHSHYSAGQRAKAVEFFAEMSATYGANDHVIYEIWNEPITHSWPNDIKPYAEAVIAAIRANDPDNLIIVGSPDYSTRVDIATADPIVDNNVAYTFHFYAGTHFSSKRDIAQIALNRNKALFVTEWGTCASSGGGTVDTASTDEWLKWMAERKISHCNWSIHDKAEAASALKPGSSPTGGWTDADLTTSGLLVRRMIRNWAGHYEAENLTIAGTSGDPVFAYPDAAASNGEHDVYSSNQASGDFLTYTLPVSAPGSPS